jgi:transcriptional regulator with XRE-family HTH domain
MAGLDVRTIQRIEKGEPASFESLKSVAAVFKVNVNELLEDKRTVEEQKEKSDVPDGGFLIRVSDGNELFALMGSAHAFAFHNDSVELSEVNDLIADFLQELHDWGDLWDEIGPGERVRTAHEYTSRIKDLEERGLWVFAGKSKRYYSAGEKSTALNVFVVYVLKSTNPEIVTIDPSKASVFAQTK